MIDGKETYRSDVINFIVPKEKDEQNSEVINVTHEPIPSNLLGLSSCICFLLLLISGILFAAVLEVADDKKTEQLARPPSAAPAQDGFRERALELLQLLILQIEKRNAS